MAALFSNNTERDQHTVIEGRIPKEVIQELRVVLKDYTQDIGSLSVKMRFHTGIAKYEKRRQELIVEELSGLLATVKEDDNTYWYRARLMAAVLVRMTEISLVTAEDFSDLKRPPKKLQRDADRIAQELVLKCREHHVQPYDTTGFASHVAQVLKMLD